MYTQTFIYIPVRTGTYTRTQAKKNGQSEYEGEKKIQTRKERKKKGGEDPLQWKLQGPGVNCGNYVPIVRERVYVSAAKSL